MFHVYYFTKKILFKYLLIYEQHQIYFIIKTEKTKIRIKININNGN